ncbi:MAG TPA: glycosyltransferase [Candidatus Omnitrophota bacterium]|nr:glycosyltransferase [Candidatus Omnitrophota bacterium]HPW77140.1 glycosyltransferase [Candidatus Omnitrophota bacterium]HQB12293.1 glycosyltransferase [Candidatus Omnitrophota bacterium]
MTRQISEARIVILNYNGEDLLTECLPSIVEAAHCSRRRTVVTVLDNRSTDGSVELLRKRFPTVEVMVAAQNRILFSYNDALARMTEPVVILLNNDIRVDKNFVDPLIDPFERDERVFAVGARCRDFDGKGFQGEKSIAGMRWGLFWTDSRYRGYEKDIERPSWTAQVALGAFDREKFLQLGGYDDLYFPGLWEDTDISFRAYRRGWHCLYEPQSIIYHKGQVSFHREYGSRERAVIAYRNTFLFMWKNLRESSLALSQWFWVPLRILVTLAKGNTGLLIGFFRAFRMRHRVASGTDQNCPRPERTIRQVLSIISSRDWRP